MPDTTPQTHLLRIGEAVVVVFVGVVVHGGRGTICRNGRQVAKTAAAGRMSMVVWFITFEFLGNPDGGKL